MYVHTTVFKSLIFKLLYHVIGRLERQGCFNYLFSKSFKSFPDLVAIPDFQAGAMENWGLITFREIALLFDSNTSSARDKKLITSVIAHELAHQVLVWKGYCFRF